MNSSNLKELSQLSTEFQQLRKIKGHFQGRNWNNEVDRWKGSKHLVMMKLASRISADNHLVSDLKKWMGQPDRIIFRNDPVFQQLDSKNNHASSKPRTEKFMIYYWRGEHDYLYFACQKEAILYSAWWYAGE